MFSSQIKKEISHMAIGIVILGIIMIGIFALFGVFNTQILLGALLGSVYTFLNFVFLSWCVQKAVDKGENGAKIFVSSTYSLRLIITAIVVVVAIKLPYFNHIATIIPLIFPRIIIMILNITRRRGDKQ